MKNITLTIFLAGFAGISICASFFTCKPKAHALAKAPLTDTVPDSVMVWLSFAGDVMGHGPQINAAYDEASKSYKYEPCFAPLKAYLDTMDLAVANLEVTLAGPPYSGYPQFSSPDELALGLKNSGFDMLITANNHSADRGANGISRTIELLDSFGISHTGTFLNSEARDRDYPLMLDVKGVRLALLNYTYGTNGIPVPHPLVVNLIDTTQLSKDIAEAKKRNAQLIIVTLHWGIEYERTQNKEQEKLAQWLAEKGCDAIVGMHPHVIQPYAELVTSTGKKVPVFYSLGNFVSNQRERYKDGGIMAGIGIMKKKDTCYIATTHYIPCWVNKSSAPVKYTIIPVSSYNKDSASFALPAEDRDKLKIFEADTRQLLPNITER